MPTNLAYFGSHLNSAVLFVIYLVPRTFSVRLYVRVHHPTVEMGVKVIVLALALIIWFQIVVSAVETDWELHQRLKTIENSLTWSDNLSSIANTSYKDNDFFKTDATKTKRSYNNVRCMEQLQWIQNTEGAMESRSHHH